MSGPQLMRATPRHVRRQLALAAVVSLALTVMVLIVGALGTGLVGISGMPDWLGGTHDTKAVPLRTRVAPERPAAEERPAPHRLVAAPHHVMAPARQRAAHRPAARGRTHRTSTRTHRHTHRAHHRAARTTPTSQPAVVPATPTAAAATSPVRVAESTHATPLQPSPAKPHGAPAKPHGQGHGHGLALGHSKAHIVPPGHEASSRSAAGAPPTVVTHGHGVANGHGVAHGHQDRGTPPATPPLPPSAPSPHGRGLARGHEDRGTPPAKHDAVAPSHGPNAHD